jgi:UDP:flavonoid glycosyltransferase YjiC (YdhE family)
VCYLPDVEAGRAPPVDDPGIAYSSKPVSLDAAFEGASLCVCHAGAGTIGRSLLAGVPLLMLPMQAEQVLNALAVERLGAGIALPASAGAQDIAAALERVHGDPSLRAAAGAFAARHREFTSARQLATLSDEIERELAAK